jgi:hypothetical protein
MEHSMVQEKNNSQTGHNRFIVIFAIFAAARLLFIPQLEAKIYQWVDVNGVVNFSNMPPGDAGRLINVFDEVPHNAVVHQNRLQADQIEADELIETIRKEEQLAVGERLSEKTEEQEIFEEAEQDQPPLLASVCFSPSYSVQQGRGPFAPIYPTELSRTEYRDLKKLLEGLDGFWAGDALVVGCSGREGEVAEQLENYSIKSKATMTRGEKFVLSSDMFSVQDRSTAQQILYLYLDDNQLTSVPNTKSVDIEVISVSPDELVYLEKKNIGGGIFAGGAPKHHEIVTTIKKTSEISLSLSRDIFQNGRLISTSVWYLESV